MCAQAEDNQEEEEEDFLDPNSAFVSVAVSKNKRSCNAAAVSHMDRSQRTSNTRKPVVSMCLNTCVMLAYTSVWKYEAYCCGIICMYCIYLHVI